MFAPGSRLLGGTMTNTPSSSKKASPMGASFLLAVIEAKAEYKLPSDGLQQAKDYAEILGVKFAYATNGHGIIEYDYFTGQERELDTFPTPGELWARQRAAQGLEDDSLAEKLLTPSYIGDKI